MNHYESRVPRFFHWKREPWAVTFGPRTTFYTVPEKDVTPRWKAHEDCHQAQITKDGWFKFMSKYLYYTIKYGYNNNPYELAAELSAKNIIA